MQEIINLHRKHAQEGMERQIGTIQEVLIEGDSKKDTQAWRGRTADNRMVVFAKDNNQQLKQGSYVRVKIKSATSATLLGHIFQR